MVYRTGCCLLYYGFTSHQQLRPFGDRYRTGKNRFNTLFLFFINWVGLVISLDWQYIIRVADENCLIVPSFQNQIIHIALFSTYTVQGITLDCGYFHRHFCAQR